MITQVLAVGEWWPRSTSTVTDAGGVPPDARTIEGQAYRRLLDPLLTDDKAIEVLLRLRHA